MLKSLHAMRDKLQSAINRAQALTDSDNDDIASKYDDVAGSLDEALTCITDAIDRLEDAT